MIDFYNHTADAGATLLDPHRTPIRLDDPAPGTRSHPLTDVPAVMAWFDTENPNLLAAQHAAVSRAWHSKV